MKRRPRHDSGDVVGGVNMLPHVEVPIYHAGEARPVDLAPPERIVCSHAYDFLAELLERKAAS